MTRNSTRAPSTTSTGLKKERKKTVRTTYRHGNLREALVAGAVTMMEERRDAAFTLREVAQRIRVSHSAAYRHFPSKGALLAEVARRGFILLTDALTQVLAEGGTAEAIAHRQSQAYVRTALTYPGHFRCMFGPRTFSEEEEQIVDEACDGAFACLNEAASRLTGATMESAVTQKAALALWSVVHGFAHLALDGHLCEMTENKSMSDYLDLVDGVAAPLIKSLHKK
jgi:AcrR family transcriptional regulator